MPSITQYRFYYDAVEGPIRNGSTSAKEAIWPCVDVGGMEYHDFLAMADEVIAWGQNQYANDHGTRLDHQSLVDFVNAAVSFVARTNVPSM